MAKYNLIPVKGNSYYLSGVFSIGVHIKDDRAVLIDSGISKENAKEIDKALNQSGFTIAAIINTHCHGDHCGGNAYFQHKYPNIQIYSTETERPFIEDPLMAPVCFCCGAAAFEDLKTCKPIAPQQPSKITHLISPYADQQIDVDGRAFEIITLPGHTRGMIAVKTPDNVLYCGDAVFGEDIFRKYPILFYTFIHDTLTSFKKLKHLLNEVDTAVIYHGGIVPDLKALIEVHEKRIVQTKEHILSLVQKHPLSMEEITASVMKEHNIPDDLISYTLTKTPMQAYVAELESEKRVEIRVSGGVRKVYAL